MRKHDERYWKIWSIRDAMGPAARKVVEEHNRLTEEQMYAEDAHWVLALMEATLKDANQELDESQSANPS